jgi:hypothetical protein
MTMVKRGIDNMGKGCYRGLNSNSTTDRTIVVGFGCSLGPSLPLWYIRNPSTVITTPRIWTPSGCYCCYCCRGGPCRFSPFESLMKDTVIAATTAKTTVKSMRYIQGKWQPQTFTRLLLPTTDRLIPWRPSLRRQDATRVHSLIAF